MVNYRKPDCAHPILCLSLLALSLIGGVSIPVSAAEDVVSVCPAIVVDIGLESSRDRALVCDGAATARAFFRSHGIEVKRRIRIRLHDEGIGGRDRHIGLYDGEKDQVELLTFEYAKYQTVEDSLFGMQMNESLYVSVVVHEIAHAIAGQNFEIRPASLVAHEYIAYAAQLSTMEPGLREEILRQYDSAAFEDIDDMSSTYYELNPSGFGTKAFRHYQSLTRRSHFIRDLLSGAIEPMRPELEWQ